MVRHDFCNDFGNRRTWNLPVMYTTQPTHCFHYFSISMIYRFYNYVAQTWWYSKFITLIWVYFKNFAILREYSNTIAIICEYCNIIAILLQYAPINCTLALVHSYWSKPFQTYVKSLHRKLNFVPPRQYFHNQNMYHWYWFLYEDANWGKSIRRLIYVSDITFRDAIY